MTQFARKHGLSRQRIHALLLQCRIKGAKKSQVLGGPINGIWLIPNNAKLPPRK